MRTICLIILLSLSGALSADGLANQTIENKVEQGNAKQISVAPKMTEIESKTPAIINEQENEKVRLFTKNSSPLDDKPLRNNKQAAKPSVSSLSNWPMVLLMLLGIVALILALAWFVKRFGGFNMVGGRDMRVLSSVPLGARERVALIDVKGQQFLVGVTTQNVNHLHTFEKPIVDTASSDQTGLKTSDFAKKFQQILTTNKTSSNDRV